MYLLKKGIEQDERSVQLTCERFSPNLLMISLDCNLLDSVRVCSYWRVLGSGKIPPLEIGINVERKILKSVTFFVDRECFKAVQIEKLEVVEGNAIVDVSMFTARNDYVDVKGRYWVSVTQNKLVCIFETEDETRSPIREAIGIGNVKLLASKNSEIRGFEICELSEEVVSVLKAVQRNTYVAS